MSNSSTADALRRLSVLESSSSSYETPISTILSRDESGMGSSMCLAELQAGDVSAVGRIAVQLFSGSPLHASPEDDCFWEWQVNDTQYSFHPSMFRLIETRTLSMDCASVNVLLYMYCSECQLPLLLLCSQLIHFAGDLYFNFTLDSAS